MRVFVTGGAGFIGGSVCRQLRARGDDVELVVIEGAGHFDVVMPSGIAAEPVQGAIRAMLRP